VAENALGRYVSNGEFIAAAIMEGFTLYENPGCPNPGFNVSERWLASLN
jgi:hypothetical protein